MTPKQWTLLGCLLAPALSATGLTNAVPTIPHRGAFLRALAREDSRYDPGERMIRTPFHSPGYHTTLTSGHVHPTRQTLNYAVALLDSGEPERLTRAVAILRRVIALQDKNPESRTYGIWSWFLEEPLDKMAPPDWNWADFCGTQLLQAARDHMDRLPPDLQGELKAAVLHAGRAIKRRNVGPGYTNIALMGAYVTLVAGEQFDDRELLAYGRARLRRFAEYTRKQGSFSEYNSPTYTRVAIVEITRMLQHVRDAESQTLLTELNRFAWHHLARRFHPATRQWAGPHSRSYRTLLREGEQAFIQRGTGSQVQFMADDKAYESLDAHRFALHCPADLQARFTTLETPRQETEVFIRGTKTAGDIIGTTYLHPDVALGTVNIGDLWNQRRPLVAYVKTSTGVAALRLRCLHDGYDYSSAGLFTVQDMGDVLAAVVFATDRGDTHISLDRIKNATIRAGDIRLRLEFEGDLEALDLPAIALTDTLVPVPFTLGSVKGTVRLPHVSFGDRQPGLETKRTADTAHIDLVLYRGEERDIRFAEMAHAAAVLALSLTTGREDTGAAGTVSVAGQDTGLLQASWRRPGRAAMTLAVPDRPMRTSAQRSRARAGLGKHNPWKAD